MIVQAPGKAFVSGEYAVLHGAPAVVAAVDRHARARLAPGAAGALSPFLQELLRRLPPPSGMHPEVDSAALYAPDGAKLGLGASAAVTVAAAGALYAAAGRDLRAPETRAALLRLCLAAHRAAQGGRGSGGDVAAAVHGGLIRFVRRDDEVDIAPAALPAGQALLFFRLEGPASTPDLLDRVAALAAADAARHAALIETLAAAAERFARAPIESLRAQLRGLAALGEAAGVELVSPACRDLAAAAEARGGAAKPSGAGGGDLAVALVPAAEAAALRRETALRPLALSIDADGVTTVPEGDVRW